MPDIDMANGHDNNAHTTRTDQSSDPTEAICDLIHRAQKGMEPFREELCELVDAFEGTTLPDSDAMRSFKVQFTIACKLLNIGPLAPDGQRGSLQLVREHDGRVWTAICTRKHFGGTKSPPNTIPTMKLG